MLERLGRGTFGDVFRFFCNKNQRYLVVKKIFVKKDDQQFMKIKIKQEFDIAHSMNHPNIGT